ncbi:DUF2934 domain-containing protein [Bradyrhizobium sp. RD5-C2]|uniref:DUF2934 domain-containing protein n=1 Tax=Bradyrhizobium sp. RD5-C2 TaxID=244562 RepID=UPI001CC6434E
MYARVCRPPGLIAPVSNGAIARGFRIRHLSRCRARARQLWEEAGRPAGRDLDFWLRAERELAKGEASHQLRAD